LGLATEGGAADVAVGGEEEGGVAVASQRTRSGCQSPSWAGLSRI